MEANKQDDKALAEDQAFIQSLYDELSESNENMTENSADQQADLPSSSLDKRIIDAAHAAVTESTSLEVDEIKSIKTNNVDNNTNILPLNTIKETPKNKRKKIAWYYPVTTAASVLLVVTIVNHQLNDPINPIYETPLVTMSSNERVQQNDEIAFSSMEMEQDIVAETSDNALSEKELAISPLESEVSSQPVRAKMSSTPLTKASQTSEDSSLNQMLSKQQAAVSAKRKMKSDNLISKQESKETVIPADLSYEKFKSLHDQSKQKTLYWMLKQENDKNYLIELWKADNTSVFYRLNKRNYQLYKSDKNERMPFSDITYIK